MTLNSPVMFVLSWRWILLKCLSYYDDFSWNVHVLLWLNSPEMFMSYYDVEFSCNVRLSMTLNSPVMFVLSWRWILLKCLSYYDVEFSYNVRVLLWRWILLKCSCLFKSKVFFCPVDLIYPIYKTEGFCNSRVLLRGWIPQEVCMIFTSCYDSAIASQPHASPEVRWCCSVPQWRARSSRYMECRPLYQWRAGIQQQRGWHGVAWPGLAGCRAFQVKTLRALHRVNAIQLKQFQCNWTQWGVTFCKRSEVNCVCVCVYSADPLLFVWHRHPIVFVNRCIYCQSEHNFESNSLSYQLDVQISYF